MRKEWRGCAASGGVCVGRLWMPSPDMERIMSSYQAQNADHEAEKLARAMAVASEHFREMADAAAKRGKAEEGDVLEAHAMMAADPLLREEAQTYIADGADAPHAFEKAAEAQAAILSRLPDAYLRERAEDVRQAARAVISELCGVMTLSMPPGRIVLAGRDIEPAQIASVPQERLAGIIICGGTALGHAFILARSRGIPAVLLPKETFEELPAGAEMFVDGNAGMAASEPTEDEKRAAQKCESAETMRQGAAVMADGSEVTLRANVGSVEEALESQEMGGSGIGLFRSEGLFFGRETLPTEDEQFEAYRSAMLACDKEPCVIRTLDAGGDKPIPAFSLPQEKNPFLGVRGIRASLRYEALFRTQLRALLRAAAFGHIAVMLPMVTNASEIKRVRAMAEEELFALQKIGRSAAMPPVGIMVETPAAALSAEALAHHAEFFSIGTNDLTQYTLAADRTNEAVAYLGDALHPAVLRLIYSVVAAANREGIPVTICGEIAADPLAIPLLAAMGRVALSMGKGAILRARNALAAFTHEEAEKRLAAVLSMEDIDAVREFLKA